jgi:hypothetical protein
MTVEITGPGVPMTRRRLIDIRKQSFSGDCDCRIYARAVVGGWMIYCVVFELFGAEDERFRVYSKDGSAVQTSRGKPKIYKMIDTLYQEARLLCGDRGLIQISFAEVVE